MFRLVQLLPGEGRVLSRGPLLLTSIVIYHSVFLAWCMGDEEEPTATSAMRHTCWSEAGGAPRIWWYEPRNALLVNERRGRISAQQVSETLEDSLALGISIDDEHDESRLFGPCAPL